MAYIGEVSLFREIIKSKASYSIKQQLQQSFNISCYGKKCDYITYRIGFRLNVYKKSLLEK